MSGIPPGGGRAAVRRRTAAGIEGTCRTFTGSAPIKGFTVIRDRVRKSTEIYRQSPPLRRSISRLARWSVAVLAVASIALALVSGARLGIAMLLCTLPAIMIYILFVRFNLTLLRDPDGRPVENLRLANVLTATRIFLVPPILVLLFGGRLLWGLILYIVAACTDIADGVAARRLGQETALGIALDPVGDIVSTAAVLAFLWQREIVPAWLFVVLVVRYAQFFIGLAVLASLGTAPQLRATTAGKIVGVVQAVGIVILLASTIFPAAGPLAEVRRYVVAVLGIAFCSVIVSQTVIGWRAVRGGAVRTADSQGS